MDWSDLTRFLRPITVKLARLIVRAILDSAADDQGIQKITTREFGSNLDRFQQYGFTARPLDGAECLVLQPNGDAADGIVIAVEDRRYRIKGLVKGEVAIYTDENAGADGHRIHLKRGGIIQVYGTTVQVKSGQIELGKGVMKSFITGTGLQTAFNSHVHPTAAPGPPSPPTVPLTGIGETSDVKGS